MQYERNDIEPTRGKFRVRGDVVEIIPASQEYGVRVEFFGDEVDRITRIDTLTGAAIGDLKKEIIFPAKHFVTPADKMRKAISDIQVELDIRIRELEQANKLIEAQRIKLRTNHDIDMMQEMGFCSGIENYSRHLSGRAPGSRPYTLLDFFPDGFLTIIDESHVTIPQIGGMFHGDRSRKVTLVEHGFRLPSALDNRPLRYDEFESIIGKVLYVSATPAKEELEKCKGRIVEQIIRPTGLLDPIVHVRPLQGQIDTVIDESRKRSDKNERVLVTTLTKRTAEDLTDYLRDAGLRVQYIHSEVDAIQRVEILRSLRLGEFDVLVGINLLREGLDLPEVSLVCILDADKEGFLRSERSLIQTAGRAARHQSGEVILFADTMTGSIQQLIKITNYRREKQMAYNREHGITPRSVIRSVEESLGGIIKPSQESARLKENMAGYDIASTIRGLEEEMLDASRKLEFERAALLRDQINELKSMLQEPPLKSLGE